MSAAALIIRIIFATVAVLAVGTIAIFGFIVLEPFSQAFGSPPASLGWGSLGTHTLTFAVAGVFGLIITIVVWLVYAPIRQDRRQQYR